ncbi:MAG: prolipoprotein diacylglyceryl transferase [Lachnospiraceae bacterium]|nr:prolipoprotein diacylglyceryl transferase [Lachnospiraceae bacterium]
MMNPTAFILGSYEISWALILMAVAILVWFNFACTLYTGKERKTIALWVMAPFAIVFCAFLSRSVYWYSHQSQFEGYVSALKSLDLSAFSLLGIVPGILMAAVLIRLVRLDKNLPSLLDSLSSPTAAGVAILYLTDLYHPACRGKMIIENPSFQILPFAYMNYNTQGEPEYRLATFFIGFILMSLICVASTVFYLKNRKQKGETACFFLLFFSAAQFVLESTRYDAGYFPANGFVSIIQIFSGVCILGVMIYETVLRIRKKQWRKVCFLIWVAQLLVMGGTGFLEYYVQRHGSMALILHPLMGVTCFLMAFFPVLMGRFKRPAK